MEIITDIFNIFDHDDNFREIMKRLLEAAIAESFNGIVITEASPGYPIVYTNAAFSEITGYRPDEVMGKSPSMLQGPKTDRTVLERLNDDLNAGRMFHGQAINYRKDGTEFLMEWKIVPIRNAAKKISHFLAIQKQVL